MTKRPWAALRLPGTQSPPLKWARRRSPFRMVGRTQQDSEHAASARHTEPTNEVSFTIVKRQLCQRRHHHHNHGPTPSEESGMVGRGSWHLSESCEACGSCLRGRGWRVRTHGGLAHMEGCDKRPGPISCLQPGRLLRWMGTRARLGTEHRAPGIPGLYAKGSLGRKLHTWPVSVMYRNPAPTECGGNQSWQAFRCREGNILDLTDYHLISLHSRVLTTARSQHATRSLPTRFTRQRKVCGDKGAAVGTLNALSGRKKDSLP